MSADNSPDLDATVGLCAKCRHVQRVRSDKGSIFYLCTLSATDPRFAKYPTLPIRSCPGFEQEVDASDDNRI